MFSRVSAVREKGLEALPADGKQNFIPFHLSLSSLIDKEVSDLFSMCQASALLEFDPDPSAASILVSGSGAAASPSEWSSDPNLDVIWNLLDYGWLSDSARSCSSETDTKPCQNGGPWEDMGPTFWSDRQLGTEMADLVDDIGTVGCDLNSFNPTVQDNAYDTWSEILDGGGQPMFTYDQNAGHDLPSLIL